ncbi:MAG: DUF1080 domain-containing protein [bacterium]|nr:DUF1080 domain-containing protein [bacterium]
MKYFKNTAIQRLCLMFTVFPFWTFMAINAWAQLTAAEAKGNLNTIESAEEVLAGNGFFEDFNRGRADNWIDDESGVWSATDGVYRMTGTGVGALRASCYNAPFDNFTYQIDVRRTQGNPDASQGMIFRLSPTGNFYVFAITSSGYYGAFKFDSRNGYELIPWTPTSAVKQGLKAWNSLKVICSGPTIEFLVNGTSLKTIKDNSPYLSGMVGVFAVDEQMEAQGSKPIVDFDNIRLTVSR